MTEQQAKQLKAGDRVEWNGDAADRGTVLLVGHTGFQVAWDNSDGSWTDDGGWRNFTGADLVERVA